MVISKNPFLRLSVMFILLINEISATSNLAYNMPATQSVTYHGQDASKAVDSETKNTCAFSDNTDLPGQPPAWWQVDLRYQSYITNVTIQFSNNDDSEYMQGFVIIVSDSNSTSSSDSLCLTFSNGSNPDTVTLRGLRPTFTCYQPLIGRYVTIRRQGGYQTRSMSLCDVTVNGFVLGSDQAHNKPAIQTRTYGNFVASYAVDGNSSTCSITASVGINNFAWWQVDLLDLYTVVEVMILSSQGTWDAQYLTSFVIEVSTVNRTDSFLPSEFCNSYNSAYITPGIQLNLTCAAGLVGRYVTIKRTVGGNKTDALTLCEVRVIVNLPTTSSSTLPSTTTASTTTFSTSASTTTQSTTSALDLTTPTDIIYPILTYFTDPDKLLTTPTLSITTTNSATDMIYLTTNATGDVSTSPGPGRTGIIIGAVIGGVMLIIIIVTVIIVCVARRKKLTENPYDEVDNNSRKGEDKSLDVMPLELVNKASSSTPQEERYVALPSPGVVRNNLINEAIENPTSGYTPLAPANNSAVSPHYEELYTFTSPSVVVNNENSGAIGNISSGYASLDSVNRQSHSLPYQGLNVNHSRIGEGNNRTDAAVDNTSPGYTSVGSINDQTRVQQYEELNTVQTASGLADSSDHVTINSPRSRYTPLDHAGTPQYEGPYMTLTPFSVVNNNAVTSEPQSQGYIHLEPVSRAVETPQYEGPYMTLSPFSVVNSNSAETTENTSSGYVPLEPEIGQSHPVMYQGLNTVQSSTGMANIISNITVENIDLGYTALEPAHRLAESPNYLGPYMTLYPFSAAKNTVIDNTKDGRSKYLELVN